MDKFRDFLRKVEESTKDSSSSGASLPLPASSSSLFSSMVNRSKDSSKPSSVSFSPSATATKGDGKRGNDGDRIPSSSTSSSSRWDGQSSRKESSTISDVTEDSLTSLLRSQLGVDSNRDDKEKSSLEFDDPDIHALEELTRRLAEEDFQSGRFEDGLEGEFEGEDEEFRESILREFRELTRPRDDVPRSRVKELYLELLEKGSRMVEDRSTADEFLARMNPAEMTSIIDLMQKTPDDIIRFFEGDEEIVEAIRQAPNLPSLFGASGPNAGVGPLLGELDLADFGLDDSDGESQDEEEIAAVKLASATDAVRKALQVFESDIVNFAQHPEELMKLASSLPTPKEQNDFLDIVFIHYTPEKLQERLGLRPDLSSAAESRNDSDGAKSIASIQDVIDPDLVAYVFREVLSKFVLYKEAPHRFDGLTKRMNKLENEMFECLVKAFWDVTSDEIHV